MPTYSAIVDVGLKIGGLANCMDGDWKLCTDLQYLFVRGKFGR